MQQSRYLIIFLLIGCASTASKKEVLISVDSAIELGHNSYIRGCIDGMNMLEHKRTKGHRLESCKIKAKEHRLELNQMIKK